MTTILSYREIVEHVGDKIWFEFTHNIPSFVLGVFLYGL